MFALTRRLTLRPGWPEDAPALSEAIGHEPVVRNLARAPHQPRFQIMTRGENQLIGGIELIALGAGVHELGYWLTPTAWGRGYATEAGRAVIDIARHALGGERLLGRYMIDNPASGRVLRKLGFVEIGGGRLFSVARHAEIECVELALDLAEPCAPPMPIAA